MKTIFMSLGFFFTSCMHSGLGGGAMQHESMGGGVPFDSSVEKELVFEDTRITAFFPALTLGNESLITLKITNVRANHPLGPARVTFHSAFIHKADSHSGSHIEGRAEPGHHSIHFEEELRDSIGNGMYTVGFLPPQPGEYDVMFHVLELQGRRLDPEIVIQARRNVGTDGHHHSARVMDSGKDYLIMGGAFMGVMMVVMWMSGGRLF